MASPAASPDARCGLTPTRTRVADDGHLAGQHLAKLNARIQRFGCGGHRRAFGQEELHQEAAGCGALGGRRGHLPLQRGSGLRHRCRHRKLPPALVLAQDVARENQEGLIASNARRADHHDFAHRVQSVLPHLDVHKLVPKGAPWNWPARGSASQFGRPVQADEPGRLAIKLRSEAARRNAEIAVAKLERSACSRQLLRGTLS